MKCNYCGNELKLSVTNNLTHLQVPYTLNPLQIQLSEEKADIPNHWKNDVITIADKITSKYNSLYYLDLIWVCEHSNFTREKFVSISNGEINMSYDSIYYDETFIIHENNNTFIEKHSKRMDINFDMDSEFDKIKRIIGTYSIF